METLLTKVKRIEEEARKRVEQARGAAKTGLADLLAAEPEVIDDVREQATRRGQAIGAEVTEAARAEINAIKQDHDRAVQAVHEAAEKNRGRVVQRALSLLAEEF